MLRLPRFRLHRPGTVAEAVTLLAEAGDRAVVLAGGTDLLPNMKHELVTPEVVVALADVAGLTGITREPDGSLAIGAMTPLAAVAASAEVRQSAPALAQAASVVAGPQLRRMGTIGGNVLLDTRCQWFNQTYFWRSAVGFCLKKDGTVCHVVKGGSNCVAAASNDTAPALMTLDAVLNIAGPGGTRRTQIDAFWTADGRRNHRLAPGEILTGIRIPPQRPGHRGAYGKLRDRGAIDYPLLGVAVRLDVGPSATVVAADVVVTVLAAAPRRITAAGDLLAGGGLQNGGCAARFADVAEAAFRQCHPLDNVPGDAGYRREMVRVYVRRTLEAAAAGAGPVHHV